MSEKISAKYLCLSSFLSPETFNFCPLKIDTLHYFKILTDLNLYPENICSICLKSCKKIIRLILVA